MAKRIAVEGRPDHYKKSVALLLVRRLLAEWVIPGAMIRFLNTRPAQVVPAARCVPAAGYIPATLPAAELPNTSFELNSKTRNPGSERALVRMARHFCEACDGR